MSSKRLELMTRCKEYPAFKVYPYYHGDWKAVWGGAVAIQMDKVESMIFVAGCTGRDPETDRQPRNWEEERRGVGKVLGGIKEQTVAAWTRIKEVLEISGAKLEDIVFVHKYLVNRDDWWDYREAQQKFFEEHCPDLAENPRPGTLIKGVKLDLPDMRVEIEVVAVIARK